MYSEIREETNDIAIARLYGKRVGIVWLREYPWDVRIEKFARTIKIAGGEPHIICRNWLGEKQEDILDGFFIHRLPYFSRFPSKINHLITSRIPFSPLWLIKIRQIIKRTKLNCIIVRDLPLLPTVMVATANTKIPVLLDMAENYPAFLRVRYKRIWYFHIYPWFAGTMEHIFMKFVDRVLVVAKENFERLIQLGLCKEKISIVSNTPYLRLSMQSIKVDPAIRERFKSYFAILYVGFFDSHRGLDVAIGSLPYILREIPNAKLFLVGSGNNEHILRRLTEDLNLTEYVSFEGYVEPSYVSQYIYLAQVCIVPHLENEHINTTLPNKLFDYMAYGKSIIVSSAKPLARIIEQEKCGLIFKAGSEEYLAQCIIRLKDSKSRELLGKNGREAVINKYNWEIDSNKLIETIYNCQFHNS